MSSRTIAREFRRETGRPGILGDLGPTLRLAGPVVASELGWMVMTVVDTAMVAHLGAPAVGATGLGGMLSFAALVLGFGLLLGLDPLVAQAFGAGDREDCRRSLWHGLYAGLVLTPPTMAATWLIPRLLPSWGIHPEVVAHTGPYLNALAWCVPPLLAFFALRRYLQAMGRVGSLVIALIAGNLANVLGNYALIDGHFGFPALGVEGSGWATVFSRLLMPMILGIDALLITRQRTGRWRRPLPRPEWARFRRLIAVGGPAAVHVALEMGVFTVATALAGRMAPAALAAHQIVLNLASVTFMVPLGVASAGAVRVGQAIGRRDAPAARRAGWTALALGAGFMATAGLAFVLAPRRIVGAFTDDPQILGTGAVLLGIAAVFQIFDGLQVVASGILRGAGETRLPMLINLVAHWGIGLPIGYVLGLRRDGGAPGLWVGLSAGLIAAGLALLALWARRSRAMVRSAEPAEEAERPTEIRILEGVST